MDIWTALRIIWRHRVVTGLGLLLTVGAVLSAASKVEPEYVAAPQLRLLPPAAVPDDRGVFVETNPYRYVGGAEGALAGTLTRVAQSQRFVAAARQAGAFRGFEVATDQGVVGIRITAETPEAALRTQDVLVRLLQEELARLQQTAGAPPQTWITATVLDQTVVPVPETGNQRKVMAAVALLGGALSCTVAFVVDALRHRAAPRRPVVPEAGARESGPLGPGGDEALSTWPPTPLPEAPRRKAIEAVAWAPPPDALPFRLETGPDDDHPANQPGHAPVPGAASSGNGGRPHPRPVEGDVGEGATAGNGRPGVPRPSGPRAGRPDPDR